MSNDELLAKINAWDEDHYQCPPVVRALRAVVELHKPNLENLCGECTSAGISMDSWELVPYPCPTIQAIEKELG